MLKDYDDERQLPSYFPNMQFTPNSTGALGTSSAADPMVKGMSKEALNAIRERMVELKKKRMVPDSFTMHNSVQVLAERVWDTSDRTSVNVAKKCGFDKDGFEKGDPLRKAIYYTNPYMTCRWCNLITYIDVATIRYMIAAGVDPSGLKDGKAGSSRNTTVNKVGTGVTSGSRLGTSGESGLNSNNSNDFQPVVSTEASLLMSDYNMFVNAEDNQEKEKVDFTTSSTRSNTTVGTRGKTNKSQRMKNLKNLEGLPACRRCGRADMFEIGPQDFSEEIEARERVERARKKLLDKAVRVIQRNYRAYLRRMYATAASRARRAQEKLYYQAVTSINRMARGRLARRRFKTEKYLAVIKDSHYVLLRHALKKNRNRSHVFWYKRADEVKLLFDDYLLLAARMGFIPPRLQMEANIKEIHDRILARKDYLITAVQKRWRGLMCRRIVIFFKTELVRLRQWIYSRVMKIQRSYRGFISRLHYRRMRETYKRQQIMEEYRESSYEKSLQYNRDRSAVILKGKYNKEREEEFTAWATGRLEGCEEGTTVYSGKRSLCFQASMYADDTVSRAMSSYLELEGSNSKRIADKIDAENERKRFINNRINERGPKGFGTRSLTPLEIEEAKVAALMFRRQLVRRMGSSSEIKVEAGSDSESEYNSDFEGEDDNERNQDDLSVSSLESISKLQTTHKVPEKEKKVISGFDFSNAESSRSASMRLYFQGELSALTNKVIERSIHDFSRKNYKSRFQEYNANKRLESKEGVGVGVKALIKKKILRSITDGTSNENLQTLSNCGSSSFSSQLTIEKNNVGDTPAILGGTAGRMSKPTKRYNSTKKNKFQYKAYKYPSNINDKPMDWLLGDGDFF